MSLLAALLPPPVVAEELRGHPAGLHLFPDEEAIVAGAVEKRRREYAAVRQCARAALAGLGYPPAPILPGERGAPGWPPGIVGSMTHCDGYAAAALALAGDFAAIGVDAEPDAPLPDGVLGLTSLAAERSRLERLAERDPGLHWDRLLFSMKEAVYKTWFPLMRRWLDFTEADIEIDPRRRAFSARLLVDGPVVAGVRREEFTGRWMVADGIILTAIALRRDHLAML